MNRLRFGYFLEYIKNLLKLRIINELVSDITEVVKKRKKVANDDVIEVSKEYIHKNYSNPESSVSEISEYIRLSTVQFNTLFKRYCGTTPGEYINQYRIKTAKELLISGNDNVSEICEKVGFLNTRTFNRVFKKYTNMTPTEYKKTKINDVAPKIVNDRTMLPARFVAENLGADVSWNEDKELVAITGKNLKTGENVTILVNIDSDVAYVNGREIKFDSPAFIENDRTYTPIRFISEELGASVEWFETEQKVVITK